MAAMSGKFVQHVLVAHCCQQDTHLSTQNRKDCCTLYRHELLPLIRGKLAWNGIPAIQLRSFSKFNRGNVYCNAASLTTVIPSVDKSAFLKLQNGSDIRGVTVDGVEGEPINLTEPVAQAIAASFASWLLEKKKPDVAKRLSVSIGHDSRISAQKLQEKRMSDELEATLFQLDSLAAEDHLLESRTSDLLKSPFERLVMPPFTELVGCNHFIMLHVLDRHFLTDHFVIASNLQEDAVSRGLAGAGFDVIQYGLASTPAMFDSTLTKNEDVQCPVDGSIMITASHLPYNRNGFKFFTNAGGLGKADIKVILEHAADIYKNFTDDGLRDAERKAAQSVSKVDYMNIYSSNLVAAVRDSAGHIEKPLEGLHIVVDAGNGAGGFFAGKVLEPLGAVTSGSQFLEPDGLFPNHIPNPEDKEAMKAITWAVLDNKADLGIIFDTDVDRSAAVDSSGREFNRNRLIALISAIVLEKHPGTTVVTDSVTSDGLTAFIEKKLGGRHHRFKRGYKNVIDEAIRLNSVGKESHLAIETSGHGALKENNWLDDGAYLMVKLLNKLASAKVSGVGGGSKVLTDLVDGLEEPGVAAELRLKINQNHEDLKGGSFHEYGEAVLQHLSNIIDSDPKLQKAPVNYEGVRVSGYGGWFLLRLSLHDPVLPLNIEAPSDEDAVKLGLAVLSAIKEFPALDTSALDKFVQV